jgi:hypothetical protein
MITLILTKSEADHADWALDPMRDYASDDPEESRYPEKAVPTLTGNQLTFPSDDRAVPLDMLYRLEVQLAERGVRAAARAAGVSLEVAS